jgi:hypothetical protein
VAAAKDAGALDVLVASFDSGAGDVARQQTLAGDALLYLAGLER